MQENRTNIFFYDHYKKSILTLKGKKKTFSFGIIAFLVEKEQNFQRK